MHIITELPTVILRPWTPRDKHALLQKANNRRVWRNLTDKFPSPYTETDADVWLAFVSGPSSSIHLTIEVDSLSAGGIGIVASQGIAQFTGMFGYWLGESYWDKDIATAAARAMVRYARSDLKFARPQAPVFEWNPLSMRVLEKAGFEREAVLRRSVFKDGQLIDSVLYAHTKKHLTMASIRTPKSVAPIVALLFRAGYAKRWLGRSISNDRIT
jgi:[ribosomal protein S5]-alanine N-acetyltransferase